MICYPTAMRQDSFEYWFLFLKSCVCVADMPIYAELGDPRCGARTRPILHWGTGERLGPHGCVCPGGARLPYDPAAVCPQPAVEGRQGRRGQAGPHSGMLCQSSSPVEAWEIALYLVL